MVRISPLKPSDTEEGQCCVRFIELDHPDQATSLECIIYRGHRVAMNNAPLIGLVDDSEFLPLIGGEIGRSTARVAFEVQGHPNFVIKKALWPGAFSNRAEYLIWQQIANEPNLAAVLGACPAMSFTGEHLLMERLNDLSTSDHIAARRVPCWVTDRKPSNFGINAAGEVKMRDYAQLNLGEFLARLPIMKV